MSINRLPRKIAEKWVEALRSGQYQQGMCSLVKHSPEGYKYCCLGVLGAVCGIPDELMLGNGYIQDINSNVTVDQQLYNLAKQKGYPKELFYISSLKTPLPGIFSGYNDVQEFTFDQIADKIEQEFELYDESEEIENEKTVA